MLPLQPLDFAIGQYAGSRHTMAPEIALHAGRRNRGNHATNFAQKGGAIDAESGYPRTGGPNWRKSRG
jgi:hypothetical protein